ncbi:MAG: hypothetical protein ACK56F_27820, partial [bacterium]
MVRVVGRDGHGPQGVDHDRDGGKEPAPDGGAVPGHGDRADGQQPEGGPLDGSQHRGIGEPIGHDDLAGEQRGGERK